MQNFDANVDWKNPVTGLTGTDATGIPISQRHKIVNVSEQYRQEMYEATKKAFISDRGTGTGNREYRSDIFTKYQKSVAKEDRLKGSWTLGRYEEAYEKAFVAACKQADSTWKPGKDIPYGVLDNVTRESIENSLVKTQGEYGEVFTRKSVDLQV